MSTTTSGQETEKVNTNIVTLTRFLTEEQAKHPEATGDFTLLCHALQFSFKSIAYYIRRATLVNLTGLAGSSNITGDDQKKLDVISNDLFIEAMRSSGKCALLVSEEEDEIIYFKDAQDAATLLPAIPLTVPPTWTLVSQSVPSSPFTSFPRAQRAARRIS
jgi:fructose-1,6-bisphosphatase I